jgi:actin-like ATPase involved in cell morphogenesis
VGYGLGVDLGTTYTAAAVLMEGRVEVAQVGGQRAEIPSLVFVRPDGEVLFGEAAERRGAAEPARLAREFKRRVGDRVPILVGGAPYSAHALTARLLTEVHAIVSRQQEGPPTEITVTHPANWGPYKRELLGQAIQLADLEGVRLRSEPEAAAVQYAAGERIQPDEVVAVYDLGGGTFDAAVLRKTATGFELLGEPEGIEQLGGIDFDEAVFGHVVATLGSHVTELSPDEDAIEALARLRRDCVAAKEGLSFDTEVMIPVALPGLHTRIRLNRSEFEAMITPALSDTVAAMRRALRSAGIAPPELRSVLLAGGSSRIPLVSQLLSTEFERPVVLDPHPEHTIALGAARLTTPPTTTTGPTAPATVTALTTTVGPTSTSATPNSTTLPNPAETPTVPHVQGRASSAPASTPPTKMPQEPSRLPQRPSGLRQTPLLTRRTLLIGAICVLGSALITGTVTLLTQVILAGRDPSAPNPGTGVTTSAPAAVAQTTDSKTKEATSPIDAMVGKWKGTARDGSGTTSEITVEITQGCAQGRACGSIGVSHVPCYGQIFLQSVSNDEVEFRVDNFDNRSNRSVCQPGAGEHFRLRSDGKLAYRTTYEPIVEGTLARA